MATGEAAAEMPSAKSFKAIPAKVPPEPDLAKTTRTAHTHAKETTSPTQKGVAPEVGFGMVLATVGLTAGGAGGRGAATWTGGVIGVFCKAI
jgi:hypothetical protein